MTTTSPAPPAGDQPGAARRLAARVAGGSVVAVGATAVVCAACGVLGAVPATIGIIAAAPVYAVGHLAVHSLRGRHPAAAAVTVAGPADQDAATLASLDRLLAEIHGKVPPIVESRVQHIATTVRQTVPRLGQFGAGSDTAHSVLRTATNYLPEAVAAYMRLPRDFADRRPVADGKTSLTILCDQLDLLSSKMDDVFDAVCRSDADALIAHGRFLAEKFGSGSLAIGEPT